MQLSGTDMRKLYLMLFFISIQGVIGAQVCNTLDATACKCKDTAQVDCDLLPDITVSYQALADTGGYMEYPQIGITGQGADDGRLKLSVAIPNIGTGPLEVRATDLFLCGNDTITDNPGVCPDGSESKALIVQRIYHKNKNTMSYYSRPAGTVAYHSLHSHFHVDNWALYTLRIKKPGETNPLLWPIVGKATKNGFCLENTSSCSQYPGYCRDSNNTILLDSNFTNRGMSVKAYFTCSNLLQGISPGYFDEYFKEFYGMWIDIPPGTCNGDYYIVVEVDPLDLIVEANETNNCIAVPIKLTKQEPAGNPLASIYAQGLTTICQGDSLKLTANGGYSYLWSTGDTLQSIVVRTAGTYSVTVNSPCGTATSPPLAITVLNTPNPPAVTGDSICTGDSALLQAAGTDSLYWYSSSTGGNVIHSGPSFTTPPLSASQIYYAENAKTVSGLNYNGGMPDSTASGHYYTANAYASHLLFDCISAFTLNAVTVYSNDTGTAIIALHDRDGYTLKMDTINVIKGKNRVPLNFRIFPGDNYALSLKGNAWFYGDTANVKYPYDLPGILSIRKSSISKKEYLFFYNWEIKTADLVCRSPRIAVKALVNPACSTVGLDPQIIKSGVRIYPHPLNTYTVFSLDKNHVLLPYSFVLYDILGRPVFKEESVNTDSFRIERNDLTAGIYIYKLYLRNNVIVTGKLIIQ